MKNSILITALLAATVVCSALYATAAEPLKDSGIAAGEPADGYPGEYGMRSERHFDRLAEVLDLTAEQQEQIKSIRAAEREKDAPLRQQLREEREKMRALIASHPFDEAAVRSLAAGQAETRTELIVSHARVRNQIDALLTPEQREKAKNLRSHMKERGHQGPRR